MDTGPEKATIVERFAGFFHMPYILGCLVISLIVGPPGAILVAYLTTGFDIDLAIRMTISYIVGAGTSYWMGVVVLALTWLLFFFVFYMAGFMRHRLRLAEGDISPILPEGERTFHETFRFAFKWWPPVVITAIVIVFYLMSSYDYLAASVGAYTVNIMTTVYAAVDLPVGFFVCANFAWVYFGSIYGLYKLGQKPLRLKPSTEDRMFGARPFGDLSLSLSTIYFSAMVILIAIGIASTMGSPIEGFFPFLFVLVVFLIFGVALFIFPLYAVHMKMVKQKESERTEMRVQAYKGVERRTEPTNDTVAEMRKKLDDLTSLMSLDVAEKSLATVPEWPIDTPVLNRFSTIVITVIAIIIANLFLRLLA